MPYVRWGGWHLYGLLMLAAVLSACASGKPKPDQINLMPAPGLYADGEINPFADTDPIAEGYQPDILYATDRSRATPDDKKYRFYNYDRARMLTLGEGDIRLADISDEVTWEEAREISLLKNRTTDYPLEVRDITEFGALERTISIGDDVTERSPEAGERFMAEVNERLARSSKKDVFIYVHGYKVNFENPLLVASELWHFLGYEGAFVAYSWPTKASVFAYFADLDNAVNSARYLRALIVDIAAQTDAERIHVLGYSAGTRLVSRMLGDLGMYTYQMSDTEIREATKLGNVILVGSDVDKDMLAGYLFDGALRVPEALTIYLSENDKALDFSQRMFRGRERVGQILDRGPLTQQQTDFLRANPQLRIIDVTNAADNDAGNGHSYFRSSPWVSSDILVSLYYGLTPEERGLTLAEDGAVWEFPENYVESLRQVLREQGLVKSE